MLATLAHVSLVLGESTIVKPISDEDIEAALEEGRKAREAVAAAEGQFIPPRGFFL